MYNNQHASHYYNEVGHSSAAMGASPAQLIAMLYRGAEQRLALAAQAHAEGNTGLCSRSLHRVTAIVDALRMALDVDAGGELAANLEALYDYLYRRLSQCLAHYDAAAVDEAVELLALLRDAWEQMQSTALATPPRLAVSG